MVILDDTDLLDRANGLDIVRRVGRRSITHAIHDVDGTHSVIRQWEPVLSAVLNYAMVSGLPEGFDSPEMAESVAARAGERPLPETDRFCIETAGMSALTQVEWAIRRGVERGAITPPGGPLSSEEAALNSEAVHRIWAGEERFEDLPEPPRLTEYIAAWAPRVFRFYEEVLAKACRDRNLAAARENPAAWRVPGSLAFLRRLRHGGAPNYFVTGSVISQAGPASGMVEELLVLGFEIGAGKLVEAIYGSTWEEKVPKREVIGRLVKEEGAAPEQVLVVGDGRSEVSAGVDLGAVVLSRLPEEAERQRAIHRELGTNYLVADYTGSGLRKLIRAGSDGGEWWDGGNRTGGDR